MTPSDNKTTNVDAGGFAVVIPVYNHEKSIREVCEHAIGLNLPVFIVDDGSSDATYARIKDLKNVCILRHPVNKGKGAALITGFTAAARTAGWAITFDADGQHAPEDALGMIQAIPHGKRPIMVGMRMGMTGEGVPWTSRFGRKFSNFWVRISGGPRVSDSQSGFRIYPLPESLALKTTARRFQFEVEILVKAAWKGIPVIEVPVRVNYPPGGERISHFRPFIDFIRNTNTFARLIVQRLFLLLSFKKRGTRDHD